MRLNGAVLILVVYAINCIHAEYDVDRHALGEHATDEQVYEVQGSVQLA